MAMVGRMSMPSAISLREIFRDAVAPRIERDDAAAARSIAETARSSTAGAVLVRSGRAIGSSAPDDTASAR